MAMTLQEIVQLQADTYGSLRRASRILQIDHGYLCRLRSGEKTKPSKITLRKLGVKQIVLYEILPQPKSGEPLMADMTPPSTKERRW